MLLACFIAVLSVLVGALLGFSRRASTRHLGPIKTFAFAAATAVVATAFLPEALGSLGAVAVVPFAIGFLSPRVLELGFSSIGRRERNTHLGLEVGYAGLSIHQLGDGVGMGALTGPSHEGHHHLDVFLAIGGHTVPVAAVVVLAFAHAKGRFIAAQRAVGLAMAVVLGVIVARYLGVSIGSRWGGVTSAVVGGLLLHIATDDIGAALPTTTVSRAIDFVAGIAGVLIVCAGGREPGDEAADPTRFIAALRETVVATAPGILLGVAAAVPIAMFATRARKHRAEAAAAALVAVPLLGIRVALAIGVAAALLAGVQKESDCRGDHALPRQIVVGSLPSWGLGVVSSALLIAHAPVSRSPALDVVGAIAVLAIANVGAPAAVLLAAGLVGVGANQTAVLGGLILGLAAAAVARQRDARTFAYVASAVVFFAAVVALPIGNPRADAGVGVGTVTAVVLGLIALAWSFFDGARGVWFSLVSTDGFHAGHSHHHEFDVASEEPGLASVSPIAPSSSPQSSVTR